jgi:rhodanese-related sulfurtransferase
MRFFSRLSTPEIGVDELDALIQSGSVRVLDVREDWEFSRGRVPGAVNVPLKKLPVRAPQLKHDRPYAVICESGSRSRGATNFLLDQGFEGAVSVKGGTSAWARTKRLLVRA